MLARHIPNAISMLRLLSALPIGWLLYGQAYGWAFALLIVAGLSDALDGFLVRRYGWYSRLGAWLDPAADKTLMLAIYTAVTLNGLLPMWLLVLVLGRDAWLTLMTLVYQRWIGPLEVQPLFISKVNTALQIVLVLVVVLKVGVLSLEATWVALLTVVVAFTTLASGAAYTLLWGVRGWNALQSGQAVSRSGKPPAGSGR